jgi:oleate hydratase
MKFNFETGVNVQKTKAYLVGGGIASLSAAVYLIRDGHVPGENIHILEQSNISGGSMDGGGDPEKGYVIRGGRMFDEEAYHCIFGIMESIPSLTDSNISIMDEFRAFNKKIQTLSKARLVDNEANIIESSKLGFNREDRLALMDILICSEESLGTKTVTECFPESFFKSNFWYQWTTSFAFEPWHSAIEFKRYLHRFMHELPKVSDFSGVRRTPYNQYDAIILPITEWLKAQGVDFQYGCVVNELEFKTAQTEKTVVGIRCTKGQSKEQIVVEETDFVFVTVGSITAGASLGSTTTAPAINDKNVGGDWKLWENIAKESPEFGRPSVFNERVKDSLFETYTVTLKDPLLFNKIVEFSGNQPGTGSLMTFSESGWFMSICLHNQPHFINQPEDVQALWGYSLYPFNEGDFVKKRMVDCTGEEILTELLYHLKFEADKEQILKNAICIPCILPFATSQFLTRSNGDRPQVVPACSKNLAFLGQFCEIEDDVVFTVDYSSRSAQTAVYKFLNLNKEVTPIYKGQYDSRVMINSVMSMMKDDNLKQEIGLLKAMMFK